MERQPGRQHPQQGELAAHRQRDPEKVPRARERGIEVERSPQPLGTGLRLARDHHALADERERPRILGGGQRREQALQGVVLRHAQAGPGELQSGVVVELIAYPTRFVRSLRRGMSALSSDGRILRLTTSGSISSWRATSR